MNKSFISGVLIVSSLVIFHLSYALTKPAASTEMVYPCNQDISVRTWPGTAEECGGQECTIPAAFFTTDHCQTYTRAPIPLRFAGAHTYHNLHISYCYNDHCIAAGEASNGINNFVPLSYISKNHGMSWKLSSQQPEPITNTDHHDRILYVSCNSSGMLCEAKGKYDEKIEAKWISQDGGDTWMKV